MKSCMLRFNSWSPRPLSCTSSWCCRSSFPFLKLRSQAAELQVRRWHKRASSRGLALISAEQRGASMILDMSRQRSFGRVRLRAPLPKALASCLQDSHKRYVRSMQKALTPSSARCTFTRCLKSISPEHSRTSHLSHWQGVSRSRVRDRDTAPASTGSASELNQHCIPLLTIKSTNHDGYNWRVV